MGKPESGEVIGRGAGAVLAGEPVRVRVGELAHRATGGSDDLTRAALPVPARPGQRVGRGIRSLSPAWIAVGSVICGFILRTVSYGTPNQLTMLRKLSPLRTV
jgi:hypothetical protein